MDTAKFIKESRKHLGLTQQELADLFKKDRSNVSFYESGKSTPPGNVVLKLIELRFPNLFSSNKGEDSSQSKKKQEAVA